MNIAIVTPYGETYSNDKLFDSSMCKIGQNLLLPGIELKSTLKKLGHEYHTADVYTSLEDIDVWVFQDLNKSSLITLDSTKEYLKYFLKRKWKYDYLYKLTKLKKKSKSVLIMQEPKAVFPQSYEKKNHKYFDRILTWDTSLIDNERYFQFFYPQVMPPSISDVPFEKKKYISMICGNKSSSDKDELYTERLKAIEYFEKKNEDFDLYGFGWNDKERISYRGTIVDKLSVLSNYKFSICFENMKSSSGYITEKIFDSFFSGCIPIYLGAEDVHDFIPEETFIDYRNFNSFDDLDSYLKRITKKEYYTIQRNIREYLNSDEYNKKYSMDAFVKRMVDYFITWN